MPKTPRPKAEFFNKPVQFQRLIGQPDSSGGRTNNVWTTVYRCFAHIDNFADSGTAIKREIARLFMYTQLYPEMEQIITIRYQRSTPLSPDLTILYKSKRYQILGLNMPHEELFIVVIPVMLYQVPGTPG